MQRYSSRIFMRVPHFVFALFFAFLALVFFYICFYETSIPVPSCVEKFCIITMASFFTWVTFTFTRMGLKDFYLVIVPGDEGIVLRQPMKSLTILWKDIRKVSETNSTLDITTTDRRVISISADVTGFDELKREICHDFELKKDLLALPQNKEYESESENDKRWEQQ